MKTVNVFTQLFADDVLLVAKTLKALKRALKELKSKLLSVGLVLNPRKSIILTNKKCKTAAVDGITISRGSHRYLGYYISANGIDWQTMMDNKYQSLCNKIRQLRRIGVFRHSQWWMLY